MSISREPVEPLQPVSVLEVRNEQTIVVSLILATLLLLSATAFFGFSISGSGCEYVGAAYNIDDNCVYYSWIRQAADGHLFIRNLFTTTPQNPVQINLLMLLLGAIVHVTGAPIPLVTNIVRILASAVLLALINILFRRIAPQNPIARLLGLFFVCFGSGFGFLSWPKWSDTNAGAPNIPVDIWQPEAFTFQSLEMSTLFAVSQLLIVATITLLLIAKQTRTWSFAVWAGVCAFLIANIHSYDILHIGAAWLVYLTAESVVTKRFDRAIWMQAVFAALIATPAVAYQFHMYLVDPAFHTRALEPTLTPPFRYYFLGYGLVFILATYAALQLLVKSRSSLEECRSKYGDYLLPICWFAAAMAIIYAPHVSFQRKMIMGADVPLGMLAGQAIGFITSNLKTKQRWLVIVSAALLTVPTTLLFLVRDLEHVYQDRSETRLSPFLFSDQIEMLSWIRNNTKPDQAILGYPEFTIFVPGWCDRQVVVGHWGETPQFANKYGEFEQFVMAGVPDAERAEYLSENHASFFVFPNQLNGLSQSMPNGKMLKFEDFSQHPRLLTPVHSNKQLTIYRINF